jgi:hypothetical protein
MLYPRIQNCPRLLISGNVAFSEGLFSFEQSWLQSEFDFFIAVHLQHPFFF